MPKNQGVRPMRPTSYDVRSRDVAYEGETSPPTACHSERYGTVHVRYLAKGQNPERGYLVEDEGNRHSSES